MKVNALRSMADVAMAISEARLDYINRVRLAFLDCHENENEGQITISADEWEALSSAICSPCRLRDGMKKQEDEGDQP